MKTKRYNANGYVTSDDSNSGMKEKYDEDEAERQVTATRSSKVNSAPMDEKAPVKTPMRPGQASSGRKTPIVTKEQLGDMELRDYLNKQRGLTRRGESSSGRKPSVSQATLNSAKSQEIIDRMAKRTRPYMKDEAGGDMKRGGAVKKMASGGLTASRRGDGIAQRGKTRGKMC